MIFGVVLCGRLHFCGGLLRTLYRSPDGSLILTWSETHAIFVWARDNSTVHLCSRHQAPSPILDVAWYIIPTAGYEDDAKTSHWCYVISCRDIPVRIVEALRGTTLASYGVVNHLEAFVAPYSLALRRDGAWLYGGITNAVALFPLCAVGNNTHLTLHLMSSSSQTNGGHRGIVSALAIGSSPKTFQSQEVPELLEVTAVGTFSNKIGIYLTEPGWLADMVQSCVDPSSPRLGGSNHLSGEQLCLCGFQVPEGKGIVQLAWHPIYPEILVVALRRASALYVYDTSYLYGMSRPCHFGTPTSSSPTPMAKLHRDTRSTYQRLRFDMDSGGRFLVAGDEHGLIRVWTWSSIFARGRESMHAIKPIYEWRAHNDAVGSVQFHPLDPNCLVSVGGARHWDDHDDIASGPAPYEQEAKVWHLDMLNELTTGL